MSVPSKETALSRPKDNEIFLFRLYIADETPNSVRALGNLRLICEEYLCDRYRIEVVDILQEPLRALGEGILVTPALVRLSPAPVRKIVGDLSETEIVLDGLGLRGGANGQPKIPHSQRQAYGSGAGPTPQ